MKIYRFARVLFLHLSTVMSPMLSIVTLLVAISTVSASLAVPVASTGLLGTRGLSDVFVHAQLSFRA